MIKLNLREFANCPEEKMLSWRGTRMLVEVTDDSGATALSDTFVLMLTWVGLIIHRRYNDVPYSVDELIPSNVVEGAKEIVYDDNTNAIPINTFLRRIMPTKHDPVEIDGIKMLIHIWQNKLNNLIVVMSEQSAISATAESVAEFMEDDGIMAIRDDILAKKITIDEGEELFSSYIREAPSLGQNTVALLARTGGVSINQAYQTTEIRGGVFDLSNAIMPNAVMVPYAHGITNLADSLGERNAAGKALTNNGKALKDSEWFHRKAHILTSVISSINHEWDCGTQLCVPIKVANAAMASSLQGKFRRFEDGRLELIDSQTMWNIKAGEVIHVRSIAYCNSHLSGVPCGVCYGMLKSAVPYNVMMRKSANVGMYSATAICNPMGQGMLSTKHFIRNAVTRQFVPHVKDKNIISSNGDEIFLQAEVCTPGSDLILKADIVNVLSDIRSLDMLDNLSLDKLPYFQEVTFRYQIEDIMMGGTTVQQHAARTSVSSRNACFSLEFLKYVLERGWQAEGKKHISIDLSGWNTTSPIFTLPYTREDLDMHRARVENFITYNKRNSAWKAQTVTPKIFGEVWAEYWSLINQEIRGINMVHVENVLFSTVTRDPSNYDCSLANGDVPKYFSNYADAINGRGAGMLMIYEKQQNVLNEIKTFRMVNRQGSPLECFFSLAVS